MKIINILILLSVLLAGNLSAQEDSEDRVRILVSPDQQLKKPDPVQYKGEKSSLIDWEDLNSEKFLDLGEWKKESKVKGKTPVWRRNLQERRLREKVGYVLECYGICRNYRGIGFAKVDYLSTVREGDEVQTLEDSYLWIYLLDGTLVRMSPKSSVTFKEINIGLKENFHYARLNSGNILWWSRQGSSFKAQEYKETDSLFLPLSFYEANAPDPVTKIKEDDLFNYLQGANNHKEKYSRLNKLIEKTNTTYQKPSVSYLVMPNGTVFGENIVAEFVVLTGNKSFIKQRANKQLRLTDGAPPQKQMTFFYRGFNNTQNRKVDIGEWYEIDPKGRTLSLASQASRFAMGEFLTQNIPTILTARELLFQRYSGFTHQELSDKELAENYGYRLWGALTDESSDLAQRVDFLTEYTRRIETTNLLVAEQFKKRLERRGEVWTYSRYSNDYFRKAVGNFYNYREGVSILSGNGESLNSERKPFWKRIHGINN